MALIQMARQLTGRLTASLLMLEFFGLFMLHIETNSHDVNGLVSALLNHCDGCTKTNHNKGIPWG